MSGECARNSPKTSNSPSRVVFFKAFQTVALGEYEIVRQDVRNTFFIESESLCHGVGNSST